MATREILSKVFILGNKLSNELPRSNAFKKAWSIVQAGSLELAVKGTTFGNRQEALRRLAYYDPSQVKAFLYPEVNNPADPQAIAVKVGIQNGRGLYRLGYVPKEMTCLVRAMESRSINLKVVTGCWQYKGRGQVTFGARISLAI